MKQIRYSALRSTVPAAFAMLWTASSALVDDRAIATSKDGALLEKPGTVTTKVVCDEDYDEI